MTTLTNTTADHSSGTDIRGRDRTGIVILWICAASAIAAFVSSFRVIA